jgi:predicted porin
MKKHLIAAGLVAAFAAPAMAQNVSVYGTIDTSVLFTQNSGGQDTTIVKSGLISTSVLGFKGSEDLGGGLKAEFDLQTNANDGSIGSGTSSFNREAWVGLSGGFGAIRVGKTDTTGVQGIDGIGSSPVLGNIDDFGGSIGKDKAQVLRYTSPTMSGVSFDVGTAKTDTATAAGTSDITSAGLYYSAGNIKAALGQTEQEVDGASNDKETQYAVSYNAGFATIGYAYQKVDSATAATAQKQTQLAVTVPLSGGMTVGASFRNLDKTSGTDYKRTALGLAKALSKRTTAYVGYASTNNDGAADKTETAVGIIHKF